MSRNYSTDRLDHPLPRHLQRTSRPAWHLVLGSALMALIAGCMGESASDKMLRMAKARAAANKLNTDEETEEEESSEAPAAKPAEKPAAEPPAPEKPPAEDASDPKETPKSSDDAVLVSRKEESSADGQSAVATDAAAASAATDKPSFDIPPVEIADGANLAVYRGENGGFGVYDVNSRSVQRQFFSEGFQATSIAISEQQARVALGGQDGSVKTFSTEPFEGVDQFKRERVLRDEQNQSLIAHDDPVTAVAIRDRDGALLTGDSKGKMRLWSGQRREPFILPGSTSSALLSAVSRRRKYGTSGDESTASLGVESRSGTGRGQSVTGVCIPWRYSHRDADRYGRTWIGHR